MWLRLLLDTIETRQGEGVAFLVEGVAFCIAGVAFFQEVMHLGRSVMHWGESGGVLHLVSTRWGRWCIWCPHIVAIPLQRKEDLLPNNSRMYLGSNNWGLDTSKEIW